MMRLTRRAESVLAAAFAVLLATVGLAALGGQASATPTNLLANSGFETGTTSGWTCSALDTVGTVSPHSGSYSVSATPAGSDFAQCSQIVAVAPSTTYTLSGWAKGSYIFLGATGTGGSDPQYWTPGGSAWAQLSGSFTTGASTTSITVYVHGWYGTGAFSADDLSLTGPSAPPPTTTPPTTPPP